MTNQNRPLIHGFDLDALRLPQNFTDTCGVQRVLTRVPVRKPPKTEFFRVRPGEAWRFQAMTLELKEEGETYLVTAAVYDVVPEVLRPAVLHTAVDRRNNVFLIPVPLPGPDGRRNPWHQSALPDQAARVFRFDPLLQRERAQVRHFPLAPPERMPEPVLATKRERDS